MISRSRASKLIAAATKQCNNDISSVNSKLPYSNYYTDENAGLTNVNQIMIDKNFNECNTDFKNNTNVIDVDTDIIYEVLVINPNQINNNYLRKFLKSLLNYDTENQLAQSIINQK